MEKYDIEDDINKLSKNELIKIFYFLLEKGSTNVLMYEEKKILEAVSKKVIQDDLIYELDEEEKRGILNIINEVLYGK